MAWTQFLHNVRQLFTFLTKVTDNVTRANSHILLGMSRSEIRKAIFSRDFCVLVLALRSTYSSSV